MQILVIAATEMEIDIFRQQYPQATCLITGVGSPASVYSLTKHLLTHQYYWVLQCGVAGSFDETIALGQSVIVEKDRYADLGVYEKDDFLSIYDLQLANENDFPMEQGWLVNKNVTERFSHYPKVSAITIHALTDHQRQIQILKSKYQAQIETMEGAVLHDICLRENIPFLQIRGISNVVGIRDKSQWKMKEAIRTSNQLLIEIYETLTKK